MKRATWLPALLLLVACGSSTATRTRLLEDEELESLRRAQPELISLAEDAESSALAARESGQDERAGDLETEARLLFDLAMVTEQTERLEAVAGELSSSLEAETSVLSESIAERESLVSARISRETRDNALRESRRAFAIAEADERRRLRRRATDVARARLTASSALMTRVDLVNVATVALGGDVPADIEASVQGVRDTQDGAAAIAQARTLHQEAMRRLRAARGVSPVSHESCQTLVSMASEAEFDIAIIAEGLVFRDVSAAQGNALSELLAGFPEGPVLLMGDATRLKRALLRRLPEERLHEVEGDESLVLVPTCVQR